MDDRLDDAVKVLLNLRVPEPQGDEAYVLEPLITNAIMDRLMIRGMVAAIQLNCEARFQAREIEDISDHRHLPPEMQALRSQSTEGEPQPDLLPGHGLAKFTSAFVSHMATGK